MNFRKHSWLVLVLIALLTVAACSSPEDKKQAFFDKGTQLFEQKNFVKAKLEFKNAIQIDPEYAKAYFMLGKTELELKNFRQAYALLNKAVELDPENLEARISLGKLLLAGKAPDKAMEQAQAVLERESGNVAGNILKASILFLQKDYGQSSKILTNLHGSGSTDPDMYLLLSSLAQKKGDKDAAKQWMGEGLKKNPKHIPLLLSMAQLELNEENFSGAETLLSKVIELKPGIVVYQLNLAKIYMAQNKIDQAEALLEKAVADSDGDEKTIVGVASFWLAAKKIDQAENIVKNALQKDEESFTYRLFLGELYAKTRRMDQAEMILRQALELNPDPANPDIIKTKLALSKILLQKAKVSEGETLVDSVIENDPKNVEAHFLKGRLYLSRKDGLNAIPEFRVVVQDRPQMVQGYLSLAQAHAVNQEFDLAMDVLEKAYQEMPKEAVLLKGMAQLNILQKKMDEAEANLIMAVETLPENLQVRMDLGDFYMAGKQYSKALTQYQAMIKNNPDLPNGYLKSAAAYSAMKDNKAAYKVLEDGYEKNPNSALLVSSLVRMLLFEKDYNKAVDLCQARLAKNDKEAFTWNLLGGVYTVQKAFDKAQDAFEKAIAIQPDWGKPFENLARVYLAKGEKETAVEKFNNALEKDPKNTNAWMILGSLYERDGEYDKALETYEKAFQNNPNMWTAANNAAFIKSEKAGSEAELQDAMDLAIKADRLKPETGVVLDTLGWIHYKLGQLEQAHDNIKKALDQAPDNNVLNYHMGMVLHQQGKVDEAKLYLEKSLNSDNDFLGAETARKILGK